MDAASEERLTLFARTDFHDQNRLIGIRQTDRRAHMYVIGKTGTGKSTLLETFIRQDIQAGRGVALLDPHGDLVEGLVGKIPDTRKNDLIYFNVPDRKQFFGFNPLSGVSPKQRPIAASGLLDAFKKIWSEFWGPRLEHILRNALLALLEQPEATLADVLRLLNDGAYRKRVADRVANAQVRSFWLKEYEDYPRTLRAEAIAPLQNKVGAFLASPILNQVLTAPQSSFDLRRIMDSGKLLLVNLAKGRIGDDASALLGALLLTGIEVAALSRANVSQGERRNFFVYVDEFQSFTTLSLASMLSELRKYRVGLVLSHQYLSQLEVQVRDAVLGNVGTIICFRIGAPDAAFLEKEFSPELTAEDLINLPNYHIYLKMMVEGQITRPFSVQTLEPFEH